MKKTSNVTTILLLGLLTVVSYWPITSHGFVGLDDPKYIYDNPQVSQGLTWSGIVWAFTRGYASNWHPLTWISHMLDCQIYGLNAGGHHFTNVLLHAINAVLLFLLVKRMTGAFWRSAIVAALFAWHPTHVESVAWAAERKDVLSTFFFLLALGAYVRYAMTKSSVERRVSRSGLPSTFDRRPSTLYYLLALFLFALGLMSKPMLVTLPFILLLLDYWPLGRVTCPALPHSNTPTLRLIAEKLPFFALSVAASIVTYLVQNAGGAVSSLTYIPLGARIANALVAYVRYVCKTLWPADLAVFYPLPDHWPLLIVVASGLLLLGLSGLIIRSSSRYPYLAVGWFWFVGMLVPTIGLVQVGSQSMADRYLYIPSIGLFVMVAWGTYDFSFKGRRAARTVTADCADDADSLSAICRIQGQPATGEGSLSIAERQPKMLPLPVGEGRGEGTSCCGEAAQPARPFASVGILTSATVVALMACLACTSLQVGYWHDEETLFRHAMEVTSDNYLAYDHLAKVCEKNARKEEALAYYTELLRLKPRYPEGQYNLGTLLMGMGKLDEAVPHLRAALAIRPEWAQAQANLGITLFRQTEFDKAIDHLETAVRLNPRDPDGYVNLGVTLLAMGRAGEAVNAFSNAARLAPDVAEPQFLFAMALSRGHRPAEALVQAERARDLALTTGRQDVLLKASELVKVCQSESPVSKERLPE